MQMNIFKEGYLIRQMRARVSVGQAEDAQTVACIQILFQKTEQKIGHEKTNWRQNIIFKVRFALFRSAKEQTG